MYSKSQMVMGHCRRSPRGLWEYLKYYVMGCVEVATQHLGSRYWRIRTLTPLSFSFAFYFGRNSLLRWNSFGISAE